MQRVKIQNLIQDQLPDFVVQSYPEFVSFLEDYYTGLESSAGVLDIINNIDKHTKLENISDLVFTTELSSTSGYNDTQIQVKSTEGFPTTSGLIKIDAEIIYYKTKTNTTFEGCSRGFSGITSYFSDDAEGITFESTDRDQHLVESQVFNLNSLFLVELYKKHKRQYAPGFDNQDFYGEINEPVVVSRLKDFYASKGSDRSFDVLFKLLWGTQVNVVKPRDFLIQASDADYRIVRDLVVERLEGNPNNLINKTLFQDESNNISRASGTITNIEQIFKNGREYFVLSLDYNPDLEVFKFAVHPKTRITDPVGLGQTYLDVDSTLSFKDSGTLVAFDNDIRYEIDYQSRSSTQFFGLTSPISIGLNAEITTPDYVYSTDINGSEDIKVKITGVLSDLNYDKENAYYYSIDDEIQIVSVGKDSLDPIKRSWIVNCTPEYEIESIVKVALKLNGAAQYRVTTFDENVFTLGDVGTVKGSDGKEYDIFVIAVSNKKEFDINLTTQIDTANTKYSIRKGISRAKSLNNSQINIFSANIQNVYLKEVGKKLVKSVNIVTNEIDTNTIPIEDTYVLTPSLPDYYNNPIDIEDLSILFSGQYDGEDLNVGSNSFITGDAVYYSYNNDIGLNIQEGQYFVYKVNASTIRLTTSRSNIRSGIFVRVFGTISNNKLELLRNTGKVITPQNLIRKFSEPKPAKIKSERTTVAGSSTGLFVNGVELINYKSSDTIFYGPIESIKVASFGDSNYDVINPPVLSITDSEPSAGVGFGTDVEGVCNVVGSLSRINILDKGFDYPSNPKITISGGNGSGAIANCNISKITHYNEFNAGNLYDDVNISLSTITFNIDHKFRDSEKVVYNSQNQTIVDGLIDGSIYFIKTLDTRSIKLFSTYEDANIGINTIQFIGYGEGLQRIQSFDKKNVISSIEVENSGSGYENKTLFFKKDNINIYDNKINILNHGYKEKQIIIFNTEGSLPVGISSIEKYYVSVVDQNSFRISEVVNVGSSSTVSTDYNFINKRFIALSASGEGQHTIKYEPITVNVESPIGINTVPGQDFRVKIEPVFIGRIDSVSLKNNGSNYGSPNILNYNRQPEFELISGSLAQLTPIISSFGELIGVVINNGGQNYNSPPLISVLGDGTGAILTPILENGAIVDTIIIDGGSGYKQVTSSINVIPTGSGAQFSANIRQFTINNNERVIVSQKINSDDGIISPSLTSARGLQYTHGYLSRGLRRKLLSTSIDNNGDTIYRDDIDNDINGSNLYHSPIVGCAYDGNPIYGPYGYANKEGGEIKLMKSGYSIRLGTIRPPISEFPSGIFVEDYVFVGNGDLDIHNGRFCKTPEYPNGIYAYFCTFNSVQDSSGPFNGFLRPVFPYVIGKSFKSNPIDFNFNQFSSLDSIDISDLDLTRYTGNLGLLNSKTNYQGFIQPNLFSEGFGLISDISPGQLSELKIINKGNNYAVNDSIFFDNTGSDGSGAYARVSKIEGRPVDNISFDSKSLKGVQLLPDGTDGRYVGFASTSHGFFSGDIVSIQNVNILSTELSNVYSVGVSTNIITAAQSIGSTANTGIVTYIGVSGNISFPTTSTNDLYTCNGELIRILNINQNTSRLKIQRSLNGISASISNGDFLIENPRKLIVNTGFTTSTEYELDREVYFNPAESITIASENFVLYSEPVSPSVLSAWDYYVVGVGTGSIDYYNAKSPTSSPNAAKVSIASTTGSSDGFGIECGTFGLSAVDNTVSVFLKGASSNQQVYIILEDGLSYYSSLVTLSEDWKRYSFTAFTDAGTHRVKIGTLGTENLLLNSTAYFYVWGLQVEQGNVRSGYYGTSGSAIARSVGVSGLNLLNNREDSEKSLISGIINTFYIPSHGFSTGELLTYRVGLGETGAKVSTASSQFPLEDGDRVYAAVYDSNTIGISTQKVGVGSTGGFVGLGSDTLTLYGLLDYGSSELNSFQTNKEVFISADFYKKTASVVTESPHGLSDGDKINIGVLSGINTSVIIAYDDLNRRLVADPKSFVNSDVNTSNNTIRIINHGYKNAQKIILNTANPPIGVENGKIYYLIIIDDNTIQLSEFYYEVITSDRDVQVLILSSQFAGTISKINPEVNVVRNSTIIFDLSDQTLSANSLPSFDFHLYTNSDFDDEYFTSEDSIGAFDVKTTGVMGEPGAKLELIIDDSVPNSLYYNLTPLNYNGAAQSKLEIVTDKFNVLNNNKLSVLDSLYSTTAVVTGVGSTTFNYTIKKTPERLQYSSTEAIITYKTDSLSAIGPVSEVSLDSPGRAYTTLPTVKKVVSGVGTNAIFLPSSNNIGIPNEVTLTDIGFDYPSDQTLRPSAQFPYTYKIEPLSKLDNIKIISPGTNYFIPPQLVVLDGFTGRINSEVSLDYDIGDTEVKIIRNTSGLYNIIPRIIPTNNPNGIRIDNIVYDSVSKEVTVGFAVTFGTEAEYPFSIGDKVLVENTNINNIVAGTGYNSSTFGYALFTVLAIDVNIGGEFPTITYSMEDQLKGGKVPGIYDSFDSFGTVTPEAFFPIFDIALAKDTFRSGESITSDDENTGIVQSYNQKNEYLKVRSKVPFKVNNLIIGSSSQNKGLISSVEGIEARYSINSNSITRKGFKRETGKLNDSFQRIHDNDYYQYFSYAVRSPISYEVWNPSVSNLNHTAGFKKFSELTIDSYDPSIVGINTIQDLNSVIAITDLTRIVDLNTVVDFDIGREKTIDVDGSLVSNEILFNLPFLATYQEFIGNRVLAIDDFSDQFNGVQRGFGLFSGGNPVFEVVFDGSDSTKVSFAEATLNLSNHYFVSGEVVEYIPPDNNPANSIQIGAADFGPGIGTTTLLPSRITIIKQDNQKVRVATSATNALLFNPIGIAITGVGIGSTHTFRALEPNNRLLISINGTIQSPMVGSAYTTALSSNVGIGTTIIDIVGVTSIFGGDLIRINNEVMLVAGLNGNTNKATVRRAWMGSTEDTHSSNDLITKQVGNYSVVNNDIHFSEGPWGNLPVGFGTTATSANEIDYSGLTTSSRFSGRIFLRSALSQGFTTVFNDAYDNNYVYDDISDQFNGLNTSFYLKYEAGDIDNVTAQNTIVLIDDIFQGPQRLGNVLTNIEGDYKLEAGGGQLLLGFNGEVTDPTVHNDINVNNVPKGGTIVDVGSLNGYGYQPLVGAGGTAVVSTSGTITSISIGNTGSGYRSGLQTVNVGIQTRNLNGINITNIGIATITDGHVTGIAITNSKVFYAPREISNIGYSSITGVTTVTTSTTHNLSLGDYIQVVGAAFTCDYYPPVDVTNALYDTTTGIMTVTTGVSTISVDSFIYDNISGLATVTTLTPLKIVPQTAIGRSFSLAGLALTCVGYGQTFGVYDFQYDNTTGLATVLTTTNHGLSISDDFKMRELIFSCNVGGPTGYGQTFTITQFKYDNVTGISTITTSNPITGIIGIGSDIRLDNLQFSCPGGSGITTTIFPDGTQGNTFTVSNIISSDQFELNVGISTIAHTYVENDAGQVTAGLTTTKFPDGSQGYFFRVNSVGTTTSFTVNVGISTISHTYISGGLVQTGITTNIFPGNQQNSPLGDTFKVISAPNWYTLTFDVGVSTIPHTYVSGGVLNFGHKLKVGTDIALTGLAFTCSYDGGVGILTHPRSTDPIYCGTQVTRINSINEFEINAGISTAESFYTSGGIVEEIILAPRMINNSPTGSDPAAFGTGIVNILDDYTFIINSGTSPYQHNYKRCGQLYQPLQVVIEEPSKYFDVPLIYSNGNVGLGTGSSINLIPSLDTTILNFELNNFGYGYKSGEKLTVAIGGTTGIPTFTTKTSNAILPVVAGGDYPHTFVSAEEGSVNVTGIGTTTPTTATYSGSTGELVLTIPSHSYTTSNTVGIGTSTIAFTCGSDGNQTILYYPKPTDPIAGIVTGITTTTANTITLFVGISTLVKYPVTDATYDPATGLSVLTIGTHNLTTANSIRLANESLLFKCSLDGYKRIEAYPRPFKDRVYGNSVGIVSYTSDSITILAGPSVESQRYQHQFVGVGSYSSFELEVVNTFQSKFSGWNVGEFIVLDKIDPFFNGQRRLFPLSVNNESISFFARSNSGINLESNLLVFINDILQTPGEGYQFTGGSTLRFTEAPKGGVTGFSTTGDTAKIFMYTGTESIDVRTVDVLPSVEVGDEIQLYSNLDQTFTEDPRLVMDIKAADKVITNNYAGQGVTLDELFERPLTWTKQIVDKFIDNDFVGKDRVYYEPVINPYTNIISSIGAGTSFVYVNSVRPLFDNPFEGIGVRERSIIEIISQDIVEPARATAVVGTASSGPIVNVLLDDVGIGYTAPPTITIQTPFEGTQATAGATVGAGGTLTSINVGTAGTGYFYGPIQSVTVNQQGSGFPKIDITTSQFKNARLKTETGRGRGASADILIDTATFNIASINITESGSNYKVGDILFVDTYDNVGLGSSCLEKGSQGHLQRR